MNKFTDKPKRIRKVKLIEEPKHREIIHKGNQTFVKCPKCGWIHNSTEEKCRFCGAEL